MKRKKQYKSNKNINYRKLPAVGSPTLTIHEEKTPQKKYVIEHAWEDVSDTSDWHGVNRNASVLLDFLYAVDAVGGVSEAKKLIEVIES